MNEFWSQVIQGIIANIPGLTILLTTVLANLNGIKKTTSEFPTAVATSEATQKSELEATREQQSALLVEFRERMYLSFDETRKQMLDIVREFAQKLSEGINDSLVGMRDELSLYHKDLVANAGQTNLMVMENKLAFDIIFTLLAQDPQLVQTGIASTLSTRLGMTREQLLNVPELLVGNLPALEGALKETLAVAGKDVLDDVMGRMGYVRKESA